MEDGIVVVAFHGELDEVFAGEGGLARPELDIKVSVGGVEEEFGGGGGLILGCHIIIHLNINIRE